MKIKRLAGIFLIILLLSLLPRVVLWMHDRFVFGLNPVIKVAFPAILFLIFISVFIISYRWLKRNWFLNDQAEPAILFALGTLCWIISAMVTYKMTLDIHTHDTLYVYSYKSVQLKCSFYFGIISLIYFIFPTIFKLDFNIRLARVHFWITFICLLIVLTVTGLDMEISRPRRYTDYGGWNIYSRIDYYRLVILFPIIAVVIAQFVFIFNIIYAILTPRRIR
jgi:cytochrome c oxidase subunit I